MIPVLGFGPWEPIGPEGGEIKAILQSTQDTDVLYALSAQQQIILSIYDLSGRKVLIAAQEVMREGMNRITVDTSTLASGMYFARLTAGDISATTRMVVTR